MRLTPLDWTVVAIYAVLALGTGLWFARRAGRETEEFFLGGRTMPWWLLGTSMVATTFSTDTPNLVTDLVRTGGVSQNWLWWAFVLTGMMTVFFYARLWRRSEALTDLGFYELRYSGKPAALPAGLPRHLPGRLLQRHDHGDGDVGRHQDRRGPSRCLEVRGSAHRGHGDGPVFGDLRAMGRGGHGSAALRRGHVRIAGRRLLRRGPAPGGRAGGLVQPPRSGGQPFAAPRLHRLAHRVGGLHRTHRRAVVEHLVPRVGARRRRIRGAAHARRP